MSEPVPGMQAERTALAWQRTGLAAAATAAVLARLTYGDLGVWALVALVVCLILCGWVLLDTRRRRVLRGRERPGIGGWAAAVCASVAVMGVTELFALAAR